MSRHEATLKALGDELDTAQDHLAGFVHYRNTGGRVLELRAQQNVRVALERAQDFLADLRKELES